MGLTNNNNINYENVTMVSCLDPTVSGQSVSISGSVGSPSTTRSEAPSIHLNDDDDDAGSQAPPDVGTKKKKRGQGQGQRATGGAKNGRGLRQFSLKVCEKVESKGTTTYNEVADELVAEFSEPINGVQAPDKQQYDEKNIRRRVYDALNVLMAMDIISKDKKEIHWRGLPRTSFNNVEVLKRDQLALRNRFEKKSAYLRELQDQYVGLQNLIQRNEQLYRSGNAPSSGVALPFILVQTRPHATVEVEISEDMQLVHFDFNSTPFEIHDDNHVLKAMKLCNQSKGGDNNGGACSSLSTECQPRVPLPSKTTIPSARHPTSPPFPGILTANAKLEH